MFEGLHRCLTTYRRKIIQKLVQCLPSFQAVQQILEGDASPPKHWCAPEHTSASSR